MEKIHLIFVFGFFFIVLLAIAYKVGYMKAKKKYESKEFKPKTFQ